MKTLLSLAFGLLKGLFPGTHKWLVSIASGVTQGAIEGVVNVKNKPQGVRVYGTTQETIENARKKIKAWRAALAERDRVESSG